MNTKKIINKLYYYSNIIVDWTFWGYFLFLIIYHLFIDKNIPIFLSYMFFLLLGLYLGYKLARCAYDYLKNNNGKQY